MGRGCYRRQTGCRGGAASRRGKGRRPRRKSSLRGVGMGLSICRSIIYAHGGRLWADANEPRGAVFQFTLPDAKKEITDPRPAAPHTRKRYEDSASDALHSLAYEG